MILDTILADTRACLTLRKTQTPAAALRERLGDLPPALSLVTALRGPGVSIIAEIKRASPSRGALNATLEPAELAGSYAAAGADAISVLTEPVHFRGALADLTAAAGALRRAGQRRPILRKDFIVDEYQLLEARVAGADAVLLIAAALTDAMLGALFDLAIEFGLWPLIEVHDAAELARVLPLRPPIIGINNRDLRDFSVSLETTRRLRSLVPPDTLVVSESGVRAPADIHTLAQWRVDAALVGEALVTAGDPATTLRAFKEAGR
jgi:indole-3-glycerol phosphate synthase